MRAKQYNKKACDLSSFYWYSTEVIKNTKESKTDFS